MSSNEGNCCREGVRSFFSRKLGRCPRCIRLSAFGTLTGWVAVAALAALGPHPVLLGLGLLLAASFTLLLIAHGVAYMLRLAALWRAVQADSPEVMTEEFRLARRGFLRAGLAALFGAAFGFRLFGSPRGVQAQGATCENPKPHPTDITIKDTSGSALIKQVCAPNQVSAETAAGEKFANDAAVAASAYCMTFTDCPPKEKKEQVCDKRAPTLNSHKFADLNVVCTQATGRGDCQGLDKLWDCTAKITKVWCECKQVKKRT